MITREKLKAIKRTENIFRQIAEEKPYLVYSGKKFHIEAEKVLGRKLRYEYVSAWLSGYRRRDRKI